MVTRAERMEALDDRIIARLETELRAAVKRRPAHEAKLAGVLRALAPHSARLRSTLCEAFEVVVRRGSFQRPLFGALARALAEDGERASSASLRRALETDDTGSLAGLSAACATSDPTLAEPLAKLAASRHAHLAFAAEIARIARGESKGAHSASIAPKIKESHRLALCAELFVPLTWGRPLAPAIGPALAVLRDAERHLGRWLVLAEVAVRAGDASPIREADERASDGPPSARAAWAMVAWALDVNTAAPSVRPTLELVARLSDRPSADRDTTFLFRLAHERAPLARAMLEGLVKPALRDEPSVRGALHLIRDYGRQDLLTSLAAAAQNPRAQAVRGMAVAAMSDAGAHEQARALTEQLLESRQLTCLAWGGLLLASRNATAGELVTERNIRRIQFGWAE
jgi:hypothetical protein